MSTSTVQAEYRAIYETMHKGEALARTAEALGMQPRGAGALPIMVDNAGAIQVANNKFGDKRLRHEMVHYHFVREMIERGQYRLCKIPGFAQLADGFTKRLPAPRTRLLRAYVLGMDTAPP